MDNSTFDFYKNKTLYPNPIFLKIAGKLPESCRKVAGKLP